MNKLEIQQEVKKKNWIRFRDKMKLNHNINDYKSHSMSNHTILKGEGGKKKTFFNNLILIFSKVLETDLYIK